MNKVSERIHSVLLGIAMIALSVYLLFNPKDGYSVVVTCYGIAMMVAGLQMLFYFFMLSRFMVGGRIMLYVGVILLDFGVFTLTLTDVPRIYILFYLLICHLFAGLVDVLRSFEARTLGAASWLINLSYGLVNIGMAALGAVFIRSAATVVYIFSAGLCYSGLLKLVNAFRKTAVVYIR